jgi:hypothetical protein
MRMRLLSTFALLAACADQPAVADDDWQFADDSDGKADSAGACTITAPPSALHIDPFYGKYCDANGIPIVASSQVPDAALHQAKRIVLALLAPQPDVRNALVAQHAHFMVLGTGELTTDLPEERDAPADINDRTRAVYNPGPPPNAFTGEENLLCYEHDAWHGENLYVHEVGHAIKRAGFDVLDPKFADDVIAAYNAAMKAGTYAGTYAATDAEEYWAEGVQSYFNVHTTWNPNDVNTRAELAAKDPTLYKLIDDKLHAVHLPTMCPTPAFSTGWYRVQNVAAGRDLDDASLATVGNYSGQYWHVSANGTGVFRLTNMHVAGQSLDVANGGSFSPEMATTGNYSGQAWKITPITTGVYRIASVFQPGMSLASSGDTLVLAPTADVLAQQWTIRAVPR